MRRDRRELRARREQRREVEHPVHLELGDHPVQQAVVGNRSCEFARHVRRERRIEGTDIDGDDRQSPG
jgi:hypothetical protein